MYKFENISKFYDLFENGLKRDKTFYLEEAKKAKGKVLEIAVGTGRIFLPMLQNGIDAYGIDVSKSMIEVLNEKAKKKKIDLRGRVTKQDMRKFKLNKKFDLITIPYRAFLHNLTPEEQATTLKQCYKHLNKGGKVILNFFTPYIQTIIEMDNKRFKESEKIIERKNYSVKLVVYCKYHLLKQNVNIEYHFHVKEKGKRKKIYKDEFKLAWIGLNEFKHLAARCDFKIEKLYGNFNRKPIRNLYSELIWILKK